MKKDVLGIVIAAIGLLVSLIPTVLYMAFLESPVVSYLNAEIFPSVPLMLLTAIVGVPISVVGILTFRKAVREMFRLESLGETIGTQDNPSTSQAIKDVKTSEKVEIVSGLEGEVREVGRFVIISRSNEVICGSCGSSSPIGARVCSNCGTRFPLADRTDHACPVCGADIYLGNRVRDLYVCGLCFSELRISDDLLQGIRS